MSRELPDFHTRVVTMIFTFSAGWVLWGGMVLFDYIFRGVKPSLSQFFRVAAIFAVMLIAWQILDLWEVLILNQERIKKIESRLDAIEKRKIS